MTLAPLKQSTSPAHANNLDMLRLILASLVVLSHANDIYQIVGNHPERHSLFLLHLSDVAVSAFFVISGMLTYISYQRDPNTARFYLRRLFRIFPAYWFLILLQIVVFAVVFHDSFSAERFPGYVFFNVITANFIEPSFIDKVWAINGALWTIKIEVAYYLMLPFLFPLLKSRAGLAAMILLSLGWSVFIPNEEIARQLPGKLFLFGLGILLARFGNIDARRATFALLLFPVFIVLKFVLRDSRMAYEITVALASVALVVGFMHQWARFEITDISYTLYLVHFPVLVLLNFTLLSGASFLATIIAGSLISVGLALLITRWIEQPGIRMGQNIVRTHQKRVASGVGS